MEGIYGQDSPAVAVVVYGNRDYDDALLELRDWCVAHGFVPVAGAAFIGEHSYSRPESGFGRLNTCTGRIIRIYRKRGLSVSK